VNGVEAHGGYLIGTMSQGPEATLGDNFCAFRGLTLETSGKFSIREIRQVMDDVLGNCLLST